jgi:flagellar basal body-associated protein FliL
MPSRKTHRRLWLLRLTLLGAAVACTGCYDGEKILRRARNDAIKTRLEEVDLGEFRVTLPQDPKNNEMTEVVLHVFGSSVRYRIAAIKRRLEDEEFLLRQAILEAIRNTTNEDLADPRLTLLRDRLLAAVNSVLDDKPVESIGFHDVRLVRH